MREFIRRMDESSEYLMEEGCYILELSNVPDDPEVSIARARVKPGETTRLHRLDGVAERYVILEGKGRIHAGSLPPQEVYHNDVVLIPPHCPQKITNIGDKDLIFLAVCTPRFTPEAYQDLEDAD